MINPSKSEVGRVSENYLNDIIADKSCKAEVNQWGNTATVINWFKNLLNKHKRKFIKFDIAEFYPSISENLLNKSSVYAKSFIQIEDNVFNAIKLERKSLLFNKDGTWVKKGDDTLFEVTIGSFDRAEICDLVGLYLLDKLSSLIGRENVALYRDDGLAAINSSSGPELYKMRKNIIALFKNEGLSLTIETNLLETDFLDVTFNLATEKLFSFRKPNNQPLYIKAKSSNPPTILRDLPNMINKRLSALSCNEEEYAKVKLLYETALNESGYKTTMAYTKTINVNNRNRARNPPYSQNVKTNIGKTLLKLVRKHFPRDHELYKIFNRNKLKLSYSCMSSMSSVIKEHNYKVLATAENVDRLCNCRKKENCPLDGKCLQTCLVYKADVISTIVLVIENLNLGIITTQIHFAIGITSKTQNFLNTFGNYKTKASTSA